MRRTRSLRCRFCSALRGCVAGRRWSCLLFHEWWNAESRVGGSRRHPRPGVAALRSRRQVFRDSSAPFFVVVIGDLNQFQRVDIRVLEVHPPPAGEHPFVIAATLALAVSSAFASTRITQGDAQAVSEAHVAASMIRLHNHRSHLAVSDYRLGWQRYRTKRAHTGCPFRRCGVVWVWSTCSECAANPHDYASVILVRVVLHRAESSRSLRRVACRVWELEDDAVA